MRTTGLDLSWLQHGRGWKTWPEQAGGQQKGRETTTYVVAFCMACQALVGPQLLNQETVGLNAVLCREREEWDQGRWHGFYGKLADADAVRAAPKGERLLGPLLG
jgi:hypothetical protein